MKHLRTSLAALSLLLALAALAFWLSGRTLGGFGPNSLQPWSLGQQGIRFASWSVFRPYTGPSPSISYGIPGVSFYQYADANDPPAHGPVFITTVRALSISWNWIIAALLIAPALWMLRWLRKRRQPKDFPPRCSKCGYDLRATPHRCPECGSLSILTKQPQPS